MRNTTGQERLSIMAILHIEKTFKINFDSIIDQFNADATERERRLRIDIDILILFGILKSCKVIGTM